VVVDDGGICTVGQPPVGQNLPARRTRSTGSQRGIAGKKERVPRVVQNLATM
jgi:hypothetical protein